MKIEKVKYYPDTKHMEKLEDELTLIGEPTPLDKAKAQGGKDELFEEHGYFILVDFHSEEAVNFEYDVEKSMINKFGEIVNARD